MKFVSLLLWVTQFGFSVAFPLCFFLLLASWLRSQYGLGVWIIIAFGVVGALTTISTVRSCVRALRKEAERTGSKGKAPKAFNDHD